MKAIYMSDLAQAYFPRSTPRSAGTQLRRWIELNTELKRRKPPAEQTPQAAFRFYMQVGYPIFRSSCSVLISVCHVSVDVAVCRFVGDNESRGGR
ncbi:DUF4248 domain-containing protein [Bacteroides zoogleoformans]|uniref:DUF4248 domain-containing protein n=1 Tax=Bacteroides zoogleoformans TaxID=28119 RepID=UPI00248DD13E|nr:DUF4248 domain-containing protein [Bacteroides zoogleoformans]